MELIEEIKKKVEYRSLPDAFVEGFLSAELKERKLTEEEIKNPKNRNHKAVVSSVRSKLREVYGAFLLNDYRKLPELINRLDETAEVNDFVRILKAHRSTKERVKVYPFLYEQIFKITGKPKSILDLACGLNPVSYCFLGCHPEYYAYELTERDADLLNQFFMKVKIKGKCDAADLTKNGKFPKTDLCFLFKAVDTLETVQKGSVKSLLSKIKSEWLVVSFPSKSLGGKKPIPASKRKWFERLLEKKEWQIVETENELFYIVKN